MDLGIKDKVIIVTGGSRGIGEAISKYIADEGAIPIIVGHTTETGYKLRQYFISKGKEAHFIETELSLSENCKRVAEETFEKYGRINALINNAGSNDSIGLESGDPEKFVHSLIYNLSHYYYMAHYCLNALKDSQGSIVNISSKTAVTGQGNTSGYAAAKGAQLALTREWAVELLPYGIRVNAVVPAEVMTPNYEKWLSSFKEPEKKLLEIKKNIPLGHRMTTKEEIASMVVYLVSNHASHITGQFLFVDGGYVHLDRSL